MKMMHNYHRKRPHLLPPLPDLEPSTIRPMDPLQPPDLLITENRFGSPPPRRNVQRDCDFTESTNNGKPAIKIFEPYPNESEKCSLQFDLISDAVFKEDNHLLQKKHYNMCELESVQSNMENEGKKLSRRQSDRICDDLRKKLRSHSVHPLKQLRGASGPKILPIPSRYTPLKPIGQDSFEN